MQKPAIWQIHEAIVGTLRSGNRLVLVAPTGSGKTTQVPQMLLDAGLAGRQKDRRAPTAPRRRPHGRGARRLGTRMSSSARRSATRSGFDDQTSLGTRICFVTEGILLRWLQDDRTLADVGAMLFDEFHERNLLSDVALALVKQLQQTRAARSEDGRDVRHARRRTGGGLSRAAIRRACPILISEGQSFPGGSALSATATTNGPSPNRPRTPWNASSIPASRATSSFSCRAWAKSTPPSTPAAPCTRASGWRSFRCTANLPPEEQDLAFAPNPLAQSGGRHQRGGNVGDH